MLFYSVVHQFAGSESLLLATGILGATVMPHAIFPHSAPSYPRWIRRLVTIIPSLVVIIKGSKARPGRWDIFLSSF